MSTDSSEKLERKLYNDLREQRYQNNNIIKNINQEYNNNFTTYQQERATDESTYYKPTEGPFRYPIKQIDPEVAEKRMLIWMADRYNGRTPEQVEVETQRIADAAADVKLRTSKDMIVSEEMLKVNRTPWCPNYGHRIALSYAYNSLNFALSDKIIQWQPQKIQDKTKNVFGSLCDWGQGYVIRRSLLPTGNMKNVFIISITLEYVKNPNPFAVAIVLGQIEDKDGRLKVYSGSNNYYIDPNYPAHPLPIECNNRVHFVLPPNYESKKDIIYMSNKNIGDKFGQDYPWLTTDSTRIDLDIQNYGSNKKAVPVNHPLTELAMGTVPLDDSELPTKAPESEIEFKDHYIMTNAVYQRARDALKNKIENIIPVQDLEKFAIHFYPLTGDPASADLLRIYRNNKESTDGAAFILKDKKSTSSSSLTPERFNLICTYSFDIYFRDIAPEAIELASKDASIYPFQDEQMPKPIIYRGNS